MQTTILTCLIVTQMVFFCVLCYKIKYLGTHSIFLVSPNLVFEDLPCTKPWYDKHPQICQPEYTVSILNSDTAGPSHRFTLTLFHLKG